MKIKEIENRNREKIKKLKTLFHSFNLTSTFVG